MNKFTTKLKEAAKGRSLPSVTMTAAVIAMVIMLNVIIYALTTQFSLYLYSPKTDDLSLTGASDELFADATQKGKKISIKFCMAEDDVSVHKTGAYVYETAKALMEKHPELIELEFINIITKQDSEGNYVDMSKYQKDMLGNDTLVKKSSVIFESGSNYRVITDIFSTDGFSDFYTYDNSGNITSFNGEEFITAMSAWVLNDEHKMAYFTIGHSEVSSSSLTLLFACSGYYINTINLRAGEIPEDAGVIVISNPKHDFEQAAAGSGVRTEIERLTDYVEKGGDIYVSLDPYASKLNVFEGFLERYGIKTAYSTTEGGFTVRSLVRDTDNSITTDGYSIISRFSDTAEAQSVKARVDKYANGGIVIRDVAALELSGNAKPLLVSSSSAVLEAGGKVVDSEGGYAIAAYVNVENEGASDASIVVVPSVYLTATDAIITKGYANKDFVYSFIDEFFGQDMLPYGCNEVYYNNQMLEGLTMGAARTIFICLMVIPVLIACVGTVIIIKRKNR